MVNMARNGVPSDIFENKCRLCGATTIRKKTHFSDAGKSLGLKRIIFKLCGIAAPKHKY